MVNLYSLVLKSILQSIHYFSIKLTYDSDVWKQDFSLMAVTFCHRMIHSGPVENSLRVKSYQNLTFLFQKFDAMRLKSHEGEATKWTGTKKSKTTKNDSIEEKNNARRIILSEETNHSLMITYSNGKNMIFCSHVMELSLKLDYLSKWQSRRGNEL